jgi:hypothetical protein
MSLGLYLQLVYKISLHLMIILFFLTTQLWVYFKTNVRSTSFCNKECSNHLLKVLNNKHFNKKENEVEQLIFFVYNESIISTNKHQCNREYV